MSTIRHSVARFAAALLCIAAVTVFAPAPVRAEAGGFRCEQISFPVTLSPADATVYNVEGVLCARGTVHNKTVQITIHGSTYTHQYWDWPYQSATYSYVRHATAAGYAVLNLDRIGSGESDRPAAELVDVVSNAYVIHQIVGVLRSGELVVPSFGVVRAERVVLVGHSLGSAIAISEAATYGDVDGVVLTGLAHTLGPGVPDLLASLYPANADPLFAGQNIPDGYLTTLPGTRGSSFFYYAPGADPAVIALDEQTKGTVTPFETNGVIPALFQSGDIHVPVLVVMGDFDTLFCAAPSCTGSGSLAIETAFYAPDACLETVVIPDTGHDINLHFEAPYAYALIQEWIGRRVGSDPRVPAPQPCQP